MFPAAIILPREVVDDHLVGIASQLQSEHLGRGLQRERPMATLGASLPFAGVKGSTPEMESIGTAE